MANYKKFVAPKYIHDPYFDNRDGFVLDYLEIDFTLHKVYYYGHIDNNIVTGELYYEKCDHMIEGIQQYVDNGNFIEDKEYGVLSPYDYL